MKKWQLAGFIFTGILGVIFHFLYDWTGESLLVASFSAINESIFEHTKLLFFPMLIFSFIQSKYVRKQYKNYWCVKLLGIMSSVVLIPVVYYTVNGIFGRIYDWVNIAIFFAAAAFGYYIESRLFKNNLIKCKGYGRKAIVILLIAALFYMVLTFIPPHIPFFLDPVTNQYGIK